MRSILVAAGLLSIAAAPSSSQAPAGEGVLCTMAFVAGSAEAGRRCHAGEQPAAQAMLDRAERKLDAYVVKNGPTTRQQLARLKRQMANVGAPVFNCAEAEPIYRALVKSGAAFLVQEIDEMLLRPGKPTLGECV